MKYKIKREFFLFSHFTPPIIEKFLAMAVPHMKAPKYIFKDNDYATVAKSWYEYVSLAEEAIFEYAFRLGARLTIEVQKDT